MTRRIHQGTPLTVRAYLTDIDNAPITEAQVEKWSMFIFDMSGQDGPALQDEHTLRDQSPAGIVLDTPQVSETWPYPEGFNFEVTATTLSETPLTAGHTYRAEFVIHLVGGGPLVFRQVFAVEDTLSFGSWSS
ncbi:MAG: hypothetical protein EKK62_09505 [Acidimicrobiia bacterium]|nr:MAG: hypothetical protein EKK62_09505 [Acidimicrobiia bacterium]